MTEKNVSVAIKAPNFSVVEFKIIGTAPYVQLRFSQKARNIMRSNMESGQKRKRGGARGARNFEEEFPQAMYVSTEGWHGIPASSFRNGMISACRVVNFKMTLAKLSVFVDAEGFDRDDATPLVQIYGEPEPYESLVRNATGVADIRVRAMWREWNAVVKVRYDLDQFNLQDVSNLLARVGMQVGLGEGRPDSKSSAGLGFGLFRLAEE